MKRFTLCALLLITIAIVTSCVPHIPADKMPARITDAPTAPPTSVPTTDPTPIPTPEITDTPSPAPTEEPTVEPTEAPTPELTEAPTAEPTTEPSPTPNVDAVFGYYTHKSKTKYNTELVDLRIVIPNIEIYQIFGTDQNFTGNILYDNPVPVLQKRTAMKLKQAAELFAQDGYHIKIYDCYRPKSVQYILYDIVQNSSYIADPYHSASNHNRAAAVDMVLVDADGNELEFPTPMHTFNSSARRDHSYNWTDEQIQNVDYMTNIMLQCGFKIIQSEWWHFSDTDYKKFEVLDIAMNDIPRYTEKEIMEFLETP